MIIRRGPAIAAVVVAFTLSMSAWAAGQQQPRRNQNQNQNQNQQAQAQQAAVGPLPTSKEEFDAFVALQNEQNPANKITLSDSFISKFPNSEYIAYVHTFRVQANAQLNRPKEAIAAADLAVDHTIKLGEKLLAKADADAKLSDRDKENLRKKDKNVAFLDKNAPEFQAFMAQSEARILTLYQSVVQLAQQMNDAAKMIEYGEKALGFKPDDLNTLMMLSNVMAERPPVNEAEKTKHMTRAEELAKLAMEEFPKFTSSPDAARLSQDQKNELSAYAGPDLSAPEEVRAISGRVPDRDQEQIQRPDHLLPAGNRLRAGHENRSGDGRPREIRFPEGRVRAGRARHPEAALRAEEQVGDGPRRLHQSLRSEDRAIASQAP
jgi:hypothetical protein